MARIPNHTLVSPTFSGVELPPGVFKQPGQAVAGLIASAGGAVDEVVKHVQEAQQIRNEADIRDRVRGMREMQANFLEEIEANKIDPANWLNEWKNRLATHEATLKEKGLPPVVIEAVTERFKDFAGQSMIQISGAALKENRRLATGSWQLDYDEAKRRQDFPRMRKLVEEGKNGKLLDDLQEKAAGMEVDALETQYDRDISKQINPLGYIKELQDGKYDAELSPLQKAEELEKAKMWQSNQERGVVNDIMLAIEAGGIKTKEELEAEIDKYPEIITADRKEVLLNTFGETSPLTFEERFVIADSITKSIEQYKKGEISLKEYTRQHNVNQMNIMGFGKRRGAGALSSLNARYDPVNFMGPDGEESKEAEKKKAEVFGTAEDRGKELIKDRANATVRSKVAEFRDKMKEEADSPYSKATADLDAKESAFALQFRAAMEDELNSFLVSYQKDNPEKVAPSFPEIEAYLNKVQPTVVEKLMKDRKEAAASPPEKPKEVGSYPVVEPDGETLKWFKEHPETTGMAVGGGLNGSSAKDPRQIMLNPFSKLTPEQKNGVAQNEAIRHFMDEKKPKLDFEPTPEQAAFFAGTEYGKPENKERLKETIVARILTGDKSAGEITPEQIAAARKVQAMMYGGKTTTPAPLTPNQERLRALRENKEEFGDFGEWLLPERNSFSHPPLK